jgi:hypothetical protein
VFFYDSAVEVYPDESVKPALGKGLNQPATVTLLNCLPRNRDGSIRSDDKAKVKMRKRLLLLLLFLLIAIIIMCVR